MPISMRHHGFGRAEARKKSGVGPSGQRPIITLTADDSSTFNSFMFMPRSPTKRRHGPLRKAEADRTAFMEDTTARPCTSPSKVPKLVCIDKPGSRLHGKSGIALTPGHGLALPSPPDGRVNVLFESLDVRAVHASALRNTSATEAIFSLREPDKLLSEHDAEDSQLQSPRSTLWRKALSTLRS